MTDRAVTAAFRFGFGLPLDPAAAAPEALLAGLSGPDRAAATWPGVVTPEALVLLQREIGLRETKKTDPDAAAVEARAIQRAGLILQRQGQRATFARALGGAALRERLAWFWTNHFTVVPRGRNQLGWPSALRDEAIRPHLAGPFAEMLKAVAIHPGMLFYLDQIGSFGPASKRGKANGRGLNENYARELLELHTLGVAAAYTQADVRELAELLAGLTVRPADGFFFDAARAEPGAETVLGVEYGGRNTAPIFRLLEDLARRPETAAHLARKLAVHFVSDQPDPALVEALAAEWRASGGDLRRVTEVLVTHPAALSGPAAKVRPPGEFMAAALHALGVSGDEVYGMAEGPFQRLVIRPLAAMGQRWEAAPGPNGWPEAASAWVTPAGMAARIEWAMQVPGRLVVPLPDPRDLARTALGARADAELLGAVAAAESTREGAGLVFASPAFNRR
ncbi:MAG: DUF1800 domain-containing protein [Rhodobacteraceae bacterium]|jgi:uncharacterized protein (DUF1800 family)|nr:DUF1800 domain-containing protein [Paracoccaceae bacterium]